jgi:tripartite-type tricarboxylate transporter receptor subunit TctC
VPPLVPDLPAISETVPRFGISNWDGIFVPAKTPARIADRLFAEITRAIKHPELIKRQNAAGLVPIASTSRAYFVRFIQKDKAQWAQLINEANIKVD